MKKLDLLIRQLFGRFRAFLYKKTYETGVVEEKAPPIATVLPEPAPVVVQPERPRKPRLRKCLQTGKRIYEDRAVAARERDRLAANTPNNFLRIYTCEFCSHWHLTHKKRYRW